MDYEKSWNSLFHDMRQVLDWYATHTQFKDHTHEFNIFFWMACKMYPELDTVNQQHTGGSMSYAEVCAFLDAQECNE